MYGDKETNYNPYDPYAPYDPSGEIFPSKKEDAHFPPISFAEIMQRLKVGRSYVSNNISANDMIARQIVTSSSGSGNEVLFDGYDLRKWLMDHATFTRQTRRIHPEEFLKKQQYTKEELDDLLGLIPAAQEQRGRPKKDSKNTAEESWPTYNDGTPLPVFSERMRKNIVTIPVKPFDFWDKKLYFPKEYYREDSPDESSKSLTAERCYRDMFRAGAIKIQIGKQKTMFYIPERDELPDLTKVVDTPIRSEQLPLVPAAWIPFWGYDEGFFPDELQAPMESEIIDDSWEGVNDKKPRYHLTVTYDFSNNYMDTPKKLEDALKKVFVIDDAEYSPADLEKHTGTATYTLHLPATEDEFEFYQNELIMQFYEPEKSIPQEPGRKIREQRYKIQSSLRMNKKGQFYKKDET